MQEGRKAVGKAKEGGDSAVTTAKRVGRSKTTVVLQRLPWVHGPHEEPPAARGSECTSAVATLIDVKPFDR